MYWGSLEIEDDALDEKPLKYKLFLKNESRVTLHPFSGIEAHTCLEAGTGGVAATEATDREAADVEAWLFEVEDVVAIPLGIVDES
ncbi:MAG: hypothetical protein ABIR96_10010 [Bdellovibrionota bacterium]